MMPSKELIDGEWMKICSRKECDLAGQYQPVSNFHKDKSKKCGVVSSCKKCRTKSGKEAYTNQTKEQKNKKLNYNRNYRERHREQLNIKRREKYASDPLTRQRIRAESKKWSSTDKGKSYQKKHWKKHGKTEKYRKYKREYYQNNELARIKNNISLSIRNALKKQGAKKDYKTFQMLSYTPQELKGHIENQFDEKMNWDNHGDYWHIDHIIPQAALPYESLEDENFQKCWALENLRPLEATENMSKGSLYEGERHTYINNKETSNGYEEDTQQGS